MYIAYNLLSISNYVYNLILKLFVAYLCYFNHIEPKKVHRNESKKIYKLNHTYKK